jgi:hypothetical protein
MWNRHPACSLGMFELMMVAADIYAIPAVAREKSDQFSTVSLEMHACPREVREHLMRFRM